MTRKPLEHKRTIRFQLVTTPEVRKALESGARRAKRTMSDYINILIMRDAK